MKTLDKKAAEILRVLLAQQTTKTSERKTDFILLRYNA